MHALIAQPVTSPSGSTCPTTGVHLKCDWGTVWNAVSGTSSFSTLKWVLTIVGVLLVATSILSYVWKRRTGQADHRPVFTTLFVGAIFLAPSVLIPVFLEIADVIVNAIVTIAQHG